MANQYQFATLTDALSALGSRLYDPTFQQWTQAELTGYVIEALRTWNALTSFQRYDMAFQTTQGSWWYDLRSVANTVIPYTATQAGIIQQIQNHLLEPPNTAYPLTWGGSAQFSFADILLALQRRQNETLGVTPAQKLAMEFGSMCGFDVPGADPDNHVERLATLGMG